MKPNAEKELETYEFLKKSYDKFLTEKKFSNSDVYVDLVVLQEVAHRYSMDIERLHHCHSIEHVDCHKIAGYLTYWITKLRPFTIINDDLYLHEDRLINKLVCNINELFAILLGIGRIKSHYESIGMAFVKAPLSENFTNAFIYLLKYRITTGDNLSLIYYFLDMLGEKVQKESIEKTAVK